MAKTKTTKAPKQTRAATKKPAKSKPEGMSALDWLETTLKRKRFNHENLHDIVVEILREVRAIRRDIEALR